MNKSNNLPDFIDVANIRDLFWNNNSDLYPSCVPSQYHRIEKTRPVFYSPYVGTCVLTGEYNHCIFNGEYYFLSKLEILDIKTGRYKYQLDYDVMINFMNRGADIKGTLIKTNREDILEGCLQTTVPILTDPVERKPYFAEGKQSKWQDNKELVKLPTLVDLINKKRFRDVTVTREDYEAFIYRVENNPIGKGTKGQGRKWLCDEKPGVFNAYALENPLIILDTLKPQIKFILPWKKKILEKLDEFSKQHKDFVITKQTTPTEHFNIGGFVLGVRNKSLGTNVVSDIELREINLTQIEDIVPIDSKTKEVLKATKTPTHEDLPHKKRLSKRDPICCLIRRPYLPIGDIGSIKSPGKGVSGYDTVRIWKGDSPQKIETIDGQIGFLWYLNKNNIALLKGGRSTLSKLNLPFRVSVADDIYSRWGFYSTEYKNIAPLGFLIWQLQRHINEWDDYEYLGKGRDTLFIRNGLSNVGCKRTYENPSKDSWWLHTDPLMERLWGSRLFSRINLDLDQFNWLSIAPSYDGYEYKYYWGNYWGYQKFFPHAGNRELWYPSRINRMNIKWNNEQLDNPYAYDDPDTRLPSWLDARSKKLDDLSYYGEVNLKNPLKQGDICTTQLEHKWYSPDAEILKYFIPFKIHKYEWNSWMTTIYNYSPKSDVPSDLYFSFWTTPVVDGIDYEQDPTVIADVMNIYPYSSSTSNFLDEPTIPGSIVFYLYKGTYRLGIYTNEETSVKLFSTPANLVSKVNDKTSEKIVTHIIRPIEKGEIEYKNSPVVSETLKGDIIAYAIGSKDGVIKKEHIAYTPNELDKGAYTFDLKGTEWYLVLNEGDVNLIAKSNRMYETIPDEGRVIDIVEDVSTYAKINQKAEFNYYGQVYPLNTKFDFFGDLKYSSQPIIVEDDYSDPDVEYKRLRIKEKYDDIDILTTIPKKETRGAAVVDSSQILMMKEKLLQLTSNYEQDKYANQLMVENKRQQMSRQREDLDFHNISTLVGMGLSTAGVVGGIGVGAATGGLGLIGAGAAAFRGASSLKSGFEFLIRYPTLMERINQDERDLLLANSQMLYQRKQNYEHDFKYQTHKLNKLTGSWQKPGAPNRQVQERFYSQKLGEKGVNAFVEIALPSLDQQEQIDHIYSTFGCECVSDWFEENPLSIKDNMEPGLYRFSKIQKGGIESSITDTTLRDILKQILENGVKFEDCEIEVDIIEKEPIYVALPTPPTIVFDPHNTKDWPKEKWDLYLIETNNEEVLNTIKKLPHYGLTDDEWNKHKDNLKDIDDQTLLDRINQIISGRESGKPVIIQLPKVPEGGDTTKLTETINALQDQITECETREANLRKLINDLNSQLSNRQTTIDQLTSDKTNLQTQLTECRDKVRRLNQKVATQQGNVTNIQGTVTALTLEKEELLKKHKECESRITRLLQAQATCDRVNTQKIKELEAQIKECKAEKDQIQSEIARVTAELTTKNKELETANRELERVKNELNTSKAEIETIKAQVTEKDTQLSTCQADSTKKEQDLRKQIQDLNAQITRNTNQISSLQTKVTNLTNKRNELTEQNKKLKEDLAGARSKANADRQLQDQVANLNKQLEAKDTELEQAHNDCERIKNELRDKQVALETEIHQHKVDKEDLTQQLNNERVRAINEKDEINKLKKQLEDSKGDKDKITELEEELENLKLEAATCDERIAAKHRELEQCRLELDIARKQPKEPSRPVIPDECDLIKSVLNEPYSYELKTRENGFDAFLDLVFDLAQNLTWEGRSRIDQKLFKIPEVVPLLERLEELKNVPIIDKAIDLTKESGYDVFRQWMEQGGDLNGRIPGIVAKYNDIKLMETPTNIHAVKAILDELNWQSYKAKGLLTEQLKTNEDLQFLFTHIYPGSKTLELYKELYGDPNIAIIRKRFTEEVECTPDGKGSALQTLDNYRRNIKHSVGDITIPTTPTPTTPKESTQSDEVQIRIKRDLVFKPTDEQPYRQVRNLLSGFHEAVENHRTSEANKQWEWTIWNYIYKRYLKTTKSPGWAGNPKDNNGYYKLVWIKHSAGTLNNSGRYFIAKNYENWVTHRTIVEKTQELWNKKNEMSVNREWLEKIKLGDIKLIIRFNVVPTTTYEAYDQEYELPSTFISDLSNLGLLEDFIKMIYMFRNNPLYWDIIGKDYTDNYSIYRQRAYSGWGIDLFTDIGGTNTNYSTREGNKVIFNVGWLFPAEPYLDANNKEVDVYGNPLERVQIMGFSGNELKHNPDNILYQFVRYFYGITKGKQAFIHPWKIGAGAAYAFLEALYTISTKY